MTVHGFAMPQGRVSVRPQPACPAGEGGWWAKRIARSASYPCRLAGRLNSFPAPNKIRLMHHPAPAEFLKLAESHSLVPVYRQLVGDTLTPVTAFGKIQEGDWSFLFESVVGGERLGRYSFLGAGPFLRFQAWDRRVLIEDTATGQAERLTHP